MRENKFGFLISVVTLVIVMFIAGSMLMGGGETNVLGGTTNYDNLALSGTLSVGGDTTLTGDILSAGSLGVASTTIASDTDLGIGTGGATSTVAMGNFCFYAQDEAGRGMYITLATSGNTVLATSTATCN